MSQARFSGKMAKIILTVFVFIIIASFIFTTLGTGSFSLSASNVAEVGNYGITPSEYNRTYNQMVQQYNQIFKGQEVPPALLNSLKQSALTRLENQKIILNITDQINIGVSPEEIKETIKKQDGFLTQDQFDFKKYQALLRANGYSPKSYESIIANDLKTQKFYNVLSQLKSSETAQLDINRIKNSSINLDVVKVERYTLRDYLPVSSAEITSFIADKKNQLSLETLYKERSSEYIKPAKYTYRNFFISKLGADKKQARNRIDNIRKKINKTNFSSIAASESEDTTTKAKRGLVGEKLLTQIPALEKAQLMKLTQGGISPVYENSLGYNILFLEKLTPAVNTSLKSVERDLAKISLQRSKTQELDKLYKDVLSKTKSALLKNAQGNTELDSIVKKYGLTLQRKSPLNKFSKTAAGVELSSDDVNKLFKMKVNEVHSIDKITSTQIIKKTSNVKQVKEAKSDNFLGSSLQAELSQKMINAYREKHPIVRNPNFVVR